MPTSTMALMGRFPLLNGPFSDLDGAFLRFRPKGAFYWELKNIYHHHPESNKGKSSQANSGSIHPYGRYGNAVKTRKTISTIAILRLVKAIFEKRAATVEVDTFTSPVLPLENPLENSPH